MIKGRYDFFLKNKNINFNLEDLINMLSLFQRQTRNEENCIVDQFYVQCTICWVRSEIKIIYFCSYFVLFY